jgi:hypothetical protein
MILLLLVPTAAVGAVPDARLTISDLTVAPDGPVTDEPITVTATVQNSGGSPEPVEVDRVILQDSESGERLSTAESPGALSQGGTLTVDLVTAFDEAGQVNLEVVAVGTDANGNEARVVRPVTMVIERAPPTLEMTTADPVVNVESPVSVRISNPAATERRNLALTLTDSSGEQSRTNVPLLAAGTSANVTVPVRPSEDGEQQWDLSLSYTTSTGDQAVTTRSVTQEVAPFQDDLGVNIGRTTDADENNDDGGVGVAVGGGNAGADDGTQEETGSAERFTIEVTNFGNGEASDIVIQPTVTSDSGTTQSLARESVGTLAPSESTSVTVEVAGRPIGVSQTLDITLSYTAATDEDRLVEAASVNLTTRRQDVGIAVRRGSPDTEQQQPTGQLGALLGGAGGAAPASGGSGSLQSQDERTGPVDLAEVEVTNFGNIPVSEVVVRPTVGEADLPRQSVGSLAPGESGTVQVDLSGLDGSTLTATVEYRYAGGTLGTANGTYQYAPASGEVRLTDVNLAFNADGKLVITGNTGNIGDAQVTAVVVSAGASEHVSPAYPQRDYFVGSIESSEFAPFELTADVDVGNVSEIPVEVTYRTGGEERTQTVSLPYNNELAPEESQGSTRLGSLGTGAVLSVLIGFVLLVPAIYLARR